jgi:hypothetical protein
MNRSLQTPGTWLPRAGLLLAGWLIAAGAWADSAPRVTPLPSYQQECTSCHVAFPPGMLPAVSWQRLMGNLTKHFGTDASLDAAVTKEIASWLNANAGTYKRVTADAPPEDRISRAPWFIRKHHEVSADVWQRPSVKSAANCSVCHPQADKGDFNEHAVRIPK